MLLRESVIALDPGSVLAGRYQIRRVVGKGATGVVLEADDRVSRSLVALKVFKPEIATDDRWQEIVGSELRHARRLSHPNVCRVFDAGDAGGYRFLSMEYAPGGSLRQRLKDVAAAQEASEGAGEPRPLSERIADARAVVDGLAAIHGAGIIHRDVKPDNVLRMEDGRLVVTDFGLAVAPGQTTFMSGYSGAVGTPSYMAPEVALGGDATMASDVFALGVILHEIFFGRRPEWETTKRGRFVKPPAIRKGSRIERSMCRLCLECLDPLAPKRPQDAAEVKKKFERAVLGRYGTVKGALKAGKWGIVAGLGIAAASTAAVFMSSRRDKQGVLATIAGQPSDWTRTGHVVIRGPGVIQCLYPTEGGRRVRLLWASPTRAAEVDVGSGRVDPWTLPPETYEAGCPQFSPDGRSMLYGTRTAQVMLADAQGANARRLVTGYSPRWLPGGREFVHGFDIRRAARTDLAGQVSLLPEVGEAGDKLYDLAVDERSGQVAAFYRQGPAQRMAVVFFQPDSDRPGSLMRLPSLARVPHFTRDGQFEMVLREQPHDTVVTLSGGSAFTRAGVLGPGALVDVRDSDRGRFVSVLQRTSTLSIDTGEPERRVIATADRFGRLSVGPAGDAVFEHKLPDGRVVVGFYDSRIGQTRILTSGGAEKDPVLLAGGRFAYIDGHSSRTVRLCPLAAAQTCRTVWTGSPASGLLGASPDGSRIALMVSEGSRFRLRLLLLTDDTSVDLGPISSDCRLRWTEPSRFWTYGRSAAFSGWTEIDAGSGQPTGRQETAAVAPGEFCPPDATGALQRADQMQSELWQVAGPTGGT
jgi:hypothetical protein